MAHDAEMKPTTPRQFSLALLGGLFAPLITILLIVAYAVSIQSRHVNTSPAAAADQEVQERIQPFGASLAIDPNAPHEDRSGEAIYNEICSGCHASGALASPKYKEKGDWGKRIAKGYDTLLTHALKGFNKMPPRGGEPDLTDQEVANALVFMANAAGAKFEPVLQKVRVPSAAELARGKAVYANDCATCHDSGMTGAQKLTDTAAWKALLKQGQDALYAAAINGSKGGPAKGGNDKLSDADTRAAVDYMISQARTAIVAADARAAEKATEKTAAKAAPPAGKK